MRLMLSMEPRAQGLICGRLRGVAPLQHWVSARPPTNEISFTSTPLGQASGSHSHLGTSHPAMHLTVPPRVPALGRFTSTMAVREAAVAEGEGRSMCTKVSDAARCSVLRALEPILANRRHVVARR